MIAFIDESFNLERGRSYYILAIAVVEVEDLKETRHALEQFYGGQSVHASPMFANGEFHSLLQAVNLVAALHDGLDIVVQRQIDPHDKDGLTARAL